MKIIGNTGGHKEERLESKRWGIAIAAVVMQLILVTGLAVMGFGFGAFFMGKIAPGMVNSMEVANTFYILGIILLILVTAAA